MFMDNYCWLFIVFIVHCYCSPFDTHIINLSFPQKRMEMQELCDEITCGVFEFLVVRWKCQNWAKQWVVIRFIPQVATGDCAGVALLAPPLNPWCSSCPYTPPFSATVCRRLQAALHWVLPFASWGPLLSEVHPQAQRTHTFASLSQSGQSLSFTPLTQASPSLGIALHATSCYSMTKRMCTCTRVKRQILHLPIIHLHTVWRSAAWLRWPAVRCCWWPVDGPVTSMPLKTGIIDRTRLAALLYVLVYSRLGGLWNLTASLRGSTFQYICFCPGDPAASLNFPSSLKMLLN